jgi:large subunit ribosomal protein L19
MDLIDSLETQACKSNPPKAHVGDTVDVHYLIREGDKERIQIFSGTVIALKGRGIRRAITVRRIVQGEGVERIFPLHGPRVTDVVISRRGKVRRARLFYMRDRIGKSTRVTELLGDKVRREREQDSADKAADAAAEKAAAQASEKAAEANEADTEAVEV